MEDVIFGGTQTRRSQGYAFVSLTIDNRDRALPMEEDEVTVSRKLYRSGESEYRIGSAQVRLRDVYELFLDTGLGRDGYSVIGQGKIEMCIRDRLPRVQEHQKDRPGDRRHLPPVRRQGAG